MVTKKNIKQAMHAANFLCDPIKYNSAFSRGVKLNLKEVTILFISGTASIDNKGRSLHQGNFLAQAKHTFDNLTALLNSENAAWNDVVQTRCYLKNMRYYKKFNEFRTKFYQKQGLVFFPASVCIRAQLCRPELLIEIEAIAILKLQKK